MSIAEERQLVIAEAKTWLGTPYHPLARVKGVGVDCATILAEVYGTALPWSEYIPVEDYPSDWHFHRDDERYLNVIRQYAEETDDPQPGDMVVVKFARAFAHGGIIVEWPHQVIHSYLNARVVVLEDFSLNHELAARQKKFFSPWQKHYGRQ